MGFRLAGFAEVPSQSGERMGFGMKPALAAALLIGRLTASKLERLAWAAPGD
jgi:hypothetical protein